MRALRHWSVRHAVGMKRLYDLSVGVTRLLRPLIKIIGWDRLDPLVRPVERLGNELFFNCKMRPVRALVHRHVLPDQLR